jgi:uncharacterized membrane protein YkoI
MILPMKIIGGALAITVAAAVALPAFADDDMSETRMKQLDDRATSKSLHVSRIQAMEIARKEGVVRFEEIDLDDGDEWEIEGRGADGREIEMEVSGHTGKITELEHDD